MIERNLHPDLLPTHGFVMKNIREKIRNVEDNDQCHPSKSVYILIQLLKKTYIWK
jgi:hypothetical protein